jgi:hypothetical protein
LENGIGGQAVASYLMKKSFMPASTAMIRNFYYALLEAFSRRTNGSGISLRESCPAGTFISEVLAAQLSEPWMRGSRAKHLGVAELKTEADTLKPAATASL